MGYFRISGRFKKVQEVGTAAGIVAYQQGTVICDAKFSRVKECKINILQGQKATDLARAGHNRSTPEVTVRINGLPDNVNFSDRERLAVDKHGISKLEWRGNETTTYPV
jgi:hypothetical protein